MSPRPVFTPESLADQLDEIARRLRAGDIRDAARLAEATSMYAHEVLMAWSLARRGEDDALPTDMQLARLGWEVETRTTTMGWGASGPGYEIWVRRWNWHGDALGSPASFMATATSEEAIPAARARAVRLALRAWREFREPGLPPEVRGKGVLMDNEMLRQIRKQVLGDRA